MYLRRFAVGEMTLKVTQGHLKWHYSIAHGVVGLHSTKCNHHDCFVFICKHILSNVYCIFI